MRSVPQATRSWSAKSAAGPIAAGRIARQHAFDTRARSYMEGAELDPDANVGVVLEIFAAIEQRDGARFLAATHPEVSMCWPPSLPWNAGVPGRPDPVGQHARSWLEVWAPLQPTATERQMHPQVVAAADDWVVVRWRQRGRSPAGAVFDGEVLGLYEVREQRLVRAQMFYFDTDAVKRFLADAQDQQPARRPAGPPAAGR